MYNQMAEPAIRDCDGRMRHLSAERSARLDKCSRGSTATPRGHAHSGLSAAAGSAVAGIHDSTEKDRRPASDRNLIARATSMQRRRASSVPVQGEHDLEPNVESWSLDCTGGDPLMKTIEEIKAAIEMALPGAGGEIVSNPSVSGQHSLRLCPAARRRCGQVSSRRA